MQDEDFPGIARATAVSLLAQPFGSRDFRVLESELGSPDPLVVYPNPLQKDAPGVQFQVLELAGEASLQIFDARGRLVHLSTADSSPLFWDGRDRNAR